MRIPKTLYNLYIQGIFLSFPYNLSKSLETYFYLDNKPQAFLISIIGSTALWPIAVPLNFKGENLKIVDKFL